MRCADCEVYMKGSRAKFLAAVHKTTTSLDLRTKELSGMKKDIEVQIVNLNASIWKAEHDIEKHKKKADSEIRTFDRAYKGATG